ncbi:MAG: DUF3662 and FHA domain-containing protein [Thermomicrobiales bacterium]
MRLRPFTRIENSLEFIVERPFAMLFKRTVQPAEIGKRLKRELMAGNIVTVRGRVAPNDFSVELHPDDFGPYQQHGRVLADDLEGWLEEIALASNLSTVGVMRVQFHPSERVRKGRFEVNATVTEVEPETAHFLAPGLTEAFEVVSSRGAGPSGYVEICSGPATGEVFTVRKQIVTIGRDLSNDLIIDSAEVSRFHAELHDTQRGVSIVDRQSMNGTFVNGVPVAGVQLIESGDQLMFGTTICRYWRERL